MSNENNGNQHLQLMSRPAARILIPNQRLQRWAFDVELVQLSQKLGIRMAEIQVSATYTCNLISKLWILSMYINSSR